MSEKLSTSTVQTAQKTRRNEPQQKVVPLYANTLRSMPTHLQDYEVSNFLELSTLETEYKFLRTSYITITEALEGIAQQGYVLVKEYDGIVGNVEKRYYSSVGLNEKKIIALFQKSD